jgi:hypothetical protein
MQRGSGTTGVDIARSSSTSRTPRCRRSVLSFVFAAQLPIRRTEIAISIRRIVKSAACRDVVAGGVRPAADV